MSTMTKTQEQADARTQVPSSPSVVAAPSWASLKSAYKSAERSGTTARGKAYDTIVRGFALTSETDSDVKSGAVKARSEASRAREVIDALSVESGNVFGLSAMRVAQVVKVYAATARAGVDPFSDKGRSLFTSLDTIRKFDTDALTGTADAFKEAPDAAKAGVLEDAVKAAKVTAKNRKTKEPEAKSVNVSNLGAVQAFAEAALPMVRKVSATASLEEKAAARKALEALIAHLA